MDEMDIMNNEVAETTQDVVIEAAKKNPILGIAAGVGAAAVLVSIACLGRFYIAPKLAEKKASKAEAAEKKDRYTVVEGGSDDSGTTK